MQQPPSFTGGDPYGTASRTEDVNWHARKAKGYGSIFARTPKFRRHRPGRDYDTWQNETYPVEQDDVAEWVRAVGNDDADKSESVRNIMSTHLRIDAHKNAKRLQQSANDSYNDAKRRKNMTLINQAVEQQVPAQPPFQRSFIPQELWHMLSPDE